MNVYKIADDYEVKYVPTLRELLVVKETAKSVYIPDRWRQYGKRVDREAIGRDEYSTYWLTAREAWDAYARRLRESIEHHEREIASNRAKLGRVPHGEK